MYLLLCFWARREEHKSQRVWLRLSFVAQTSIVLESKGGFWRCSVVERAYYTLLWGPFSELRGEKTHVHRGSDTLKITSQGLCQSCLGDVVRYLRLTPDK